MGYHRLHPGAVAFVVGFPGLIGVTMLVAASSRSGVTDGAFVPGVTLVAIAVVLLILGLRSVISVGRDDVMVRFFGLRATIVRLREVQSATFRMALPSISYAIELVDLAGHHVLVHANWWQDERSLVVPICRALVEFDVPMDRTTARVVSRVLRVPRPKARIVHHGLLRKDRTW